MNEMPISPPPAKMVDNGGAPMQSRAMDRRTGGVRSRGLLCFVGLLIVVGLVFALALLTPSWGGLAHAQEPTPTGTTDVPTDTPTVGDTATPTGTSVLTETATETPTEVPTETPTEVPTETQVSTETATPSPQPTDTSTPPPADTPLPTETVTPTVSTSTATPTAASPFPTDWPKGRLSEHQPPRLRQSLAIPSRETTHGVAMDRTPTLVQSSMTAPWPMYMHDLPHSNYNSAETRLEPPFIQAWGFQPEDGIEYMAWSQPVVTDDTIYMTSGMLNVLGGKVYALDSMTGTIKWSRELGGYPDYSTPAVVGGVLYIGVWGGSYPYSSDSLLYALDANTGAILWQNNLGPGDELVPAVYGGKVYTVHNTGSGAQILYAFDASSGAQLWSYSPSSHSTVAGSPMVIGGRVVYYTGRQIVAVDAETGALVWETSFFNRTARLASWYWDLASSEEDGLIYATLYGSGAPFYLCALNADTGTVAWSHDFGGWTATMATPIVAEGKVYVSSWSQDGEDLWIFDAATGVPKGSYTLPSVDGDYTFMTMANGVLYATTNLYWYPVIYALDATDGSLLWSAPMNDASVWPAVPANGRLYVNSETYGLLAFAPERVWVDVEVSTDTLTTTSEGWPTPNPLVITVTVGNNTDEVVENTAILFTLNSTDWLARFYVLEENEHGDGAYDQLVENQYIERYPEDYTLTLAPGMGIRTIWRVWVQPSEATTLTASAQLVQGTPGVLAEDGADIGIPLAQIHPVIFIPGILGTMPPTESSLGKMDPNQDIYGPLLETLAKMGYVGRMGPNVITLFPMPYDWRRSNRLSADRLDEKITEVLAETAGIPYVVQDGKVDVVVHSMGGLITRAYVQGLGIDDENKTEEYPDGVPITYDEDINKVIFIATPHKGFPINYRTWEGLTWSDFMYNDNEWHLRLLTDLVLWPNLIEKKYGFADVLSDPACRPRTSVIRIGDTELRIPHIFCPWPKLYELSHHPSRGITSLLEMLPTELEGQWGDVPDYLCAEVEQGQGCVPGTSYPYQDEYGNRYEANVFLHALNMYIDDLAVGLGDGDREVGLEKIYVLYGTDKDTDHWYEVGESHWLPLWKYGMPDSLDPFEDKYETLDGDDLIPTYSARLKLPDMLPDLLESNEQDIAAPDATHKGIMYNDETQRKWVPRFLTGIEAEIPFSTAHTVPPFLISPKQWFVLTSLCPVNLMVTDSMGRRVGYDPATGQEINEIPDAFYLGAGLEMQYIIVPDGPEGQYEVTATGYEDGEYALAAHRIDDSGVRHLAVFTGTATVGQVHTHAVYYQPDLAVEAGQDQRVDEGSPVSFSGSFSGPGDPDSYAVAWDLGDGTTVSEVLTPTHRYGDDGYYTAALAVASSEGWGLADSLMVAVANMPPIVEAGPDQVVNVGEEVIFEGGFDDPGWLDTHTIEWEFGDGITQTGTLTVSHVYTASGVYTATLTVSDDDGGAGSDAVVIIVNPATPPDDASNSMAEVTETSPNNEKIERYINPSGDEDWFRFELEDESNINVQLTSLPADYDLYLYDTEGVLLEASERRGQRAERIIRKNQPAGFYYVQVVGYQGAWSAEKSYLLRFKVNQ